MKKIRAKIGCGMSYEAKMLMLKAQEESQAKGQKVIVLDPKSEFMDEVSKKVKKK